MPWKHEPYIPQGVGEIMDLLGLMMLSSPTFADKTGYFPHRDIDYVFYQLNEALRLIQPKLGDERYEALVALSNQMRAHFEADPEEKTGEAIAGRELIHEMEDLLRRRKR